MPNISKLVFDYHSVHEVSVFVLFSWRHPELLRCWLREAFQSPTKDTRSVLLNQWLLNFFIVKIKDVFSRAIECQYCVLKVVELKGDFCQVSRDDDFSIEVSCRTRIFFNTRILLAFEEYELKKRQFWVSFRYPGSVLGSVLVSIKICRLLPSLSSLRKNVFVFVRTKSEFTFQQESTTSWSGEVCNGKSILYCKPSREIRVGWGVIQYL